MLNVQIMSDLHIEVLEETPEIEEYITPKADILILAGDIGRINKYEQLSLFLKKLCPKFKHVLYVLGNHEYYRVKGTRNKSMQQLFEELSKLQDEIKNLHILNRSSVIIDDVCIIGCTLWSEVLLEVPKFIVRVSGMSTEKYLSLYNQDVNYIEYMIEYCKKLNLKLVVVTHHCPTYQVSRTRDEDTYKSLYFSNLDRLLTKEKVNTWICGHNHFNFDYITEGGTHLVSNQKGKPKDNTVGFSKEKLINM